MLLLSEDLPLRASDALGDFLESKPLAHVYGDLSDSAIPLTALSNTDFHASEGGIEVLAVYVDQREIHDWEAYSGAGYTGIRLSSPLANGSTISAAVQGKRSAQTGAIIENPADIIADLFALAGRTAPQAALVTFRAATAGIKLAGWLGTVQSIRAAINTVVQSAGAIWTPSAFALYPQTAPSSALYTLTPVNSSAPALSRDAADCAGILTLSYAQNFALGRPAQSITFAARGSRYTNTVIAAAPWLRSPRDAEAIGKRVLSRIAGDTFAVAMLAAIPDDAYGGLDAIAIGQWVALAHPGAVGMMMITGRQWAPQSRVVTLAGELASSLSSRIDITARSAARAVAKEGGVEVGYRNGIATFTVLDPNGKPLPGAQVSLDGGFAKMTDERGQVKFETQQGTHKLAVASKGYVPFEIEVQV